MPVAMTPPISITDLVIRDLSAADYNQGFLECLAFLTTVGEISESQFLERLAVFQRNPEMFRLRVVEDQRTGRIIGAGTLLMEPKFIHGCGQTGHIEDIVVHEAARGLGLGRKIIDDLTQLARESGCYKVILECSDDNLAFYGKCGFERKGNQMCIYF